MLIVSNSQLKRKILRDVEKKGGAFEDRLREWCFENLPCSSDPIDQKDGKFVWIFHQKLWRIFLKMQLTKRGLWCGGHAEFLVQVYRLFGINATTANFGKKGTGATHVVTLVNVGGKRIVQDAYLNQKIEQDIGKIIQLADANRFSEINLETFPAKKLVSRQIRSDFSKMITWHMSRAAKREFGESNYLKLFSNQIHHVG